MGALPTPHPVTVLAPAQMAPSMGKAPSGTAPGAAAAVAGGPSLEASGSDLGAGGASHSSMVESIQRMSDGPRPTHPYPCANLPRLRGG
jgi:hypothetical protein